MLVEMTAAGKVKHMANQSCALVSLRQKTSNFAEGSITVPMLLPQVLQSLIS